MNQKDDLENILICGAQTLAGGICSVRVKEINERCFFHDSTRAQDRREAQIRGGQGNRATALPVDAPEFTPPEKVGDLKPLLSDTIKNVLNGKLRPNAGTTVCNLINTFIKVLEVSDLEQRLDDLERQLQESRRPTGLFDPCKEQEN